MFCVKTEEIDPAAHLNPLSEISFLPVEFQVVASKVHLNMKQEVLTADTRLIVSGRSAMTVDGR